MAQIINQFDPWANIGKGLGEGAGNELQARSENRLLKSGLESFAKEAPNLEPLQAYAKLNSIRGVTPQMTQTFPELLKQQQTRQFYNQQAQGQQPGMPQEGNQGFSSKLPVQFGSNKQTAQSPKIQAEVNLPENISKEPSQGQGLNETNPLNALPGRHYTPQRRAQELAKYMNSVPGASVQDANQHVDRQEQAELAQYEDEQRIYEAREQRNREVDAEYVKLRNDLFQKPEGQIFNSLDAETDNRIRNAMYDDIKANPNLSTKQAANKWAKRALDLSKAQTQFDKIASSTRGEKNPEEKLKGLKNLQKTYAEAGNQEGFYNRLISDFELTPQYAALVAYPRSKEVKDYIQDAPRSKNVNDSVAKAVHIGKMLDDNDSLLAIAKSFKAKDPAFDEIAFFDEFRNNEDKYRLNPRQRREATEGPAAIFPSWGDFWLFPTFSRSVVHD